MELTNDNYYSIEANQEYISCSQFKDFTGTYGKPGCEACALAKIKGEWKDEVTTALLVGSFVDSFYEGTLDKFKVDHPEIFTTRGPNKGDLKADYKQAEKIIERTLKDTAFQRYMSGKKQVIMTGDMFGASWKIKIDSYHEGQVIVDLKVMESIQKKKYVQDIGHTEFIRYWGYDIQGAIYQKVVEINTGKRLPFFIAAATKSDHPRIELIQIPQEILNNALTVVEHNTQRIVSIKAGEIVPDRCELESCHYCCDTYEIKKPIGLYDLIGGI
jgi:hypothetical protein